MVRDICDTANGAHSKMHLYDGTEVNPVHMDEFCYLTSDDDADLMDVIELYRALPGDESFLKLIEEDTEKEKPQLLETSQSKTCRKRKGRARSTSRGGGSPITTTAAEPPHGGGMGAIDVDQFDFSDHGISMMLAASRAAASGKMGSVPQA